MSTTTIAAIRDRISTVIAALVPTSLVTDRFKPYRNEGAGDFVAWVTANPATALRRFQVRCLTPATEPTVSNLDVESVTAIFGVLVTYPQSARYGAQNALDRDDVMDQDLKQIERNVGLGGADNFLGAYPNASFVGRTVNIVRENTVGVDAIELAMTFEFYRSTT